MSVMWELVRGRFGKMSRKKKETDEFARAILTKLYWDDCPRILVMLMDGKRLSIEISEPQLDAMMTDIENRQRHSVLTFRKITQEDGA